MMSKTLQPINMKFIVIISVITISLLLALIPLQRAHAAPGDYTYSHTIGHYVGSPEENTGGLYMPYYSVARDASGTVYVLDDTEITENNPAAGEYSTYALIKKYDSNGDYLDSVRIRTQYSNDNTGRAFEACATRGSTAFDVDNSGNIYIVGGLQCFQSENNGVTNSLYYAARYPSSGGDPVFLGAADESYSPTAGAVDIKNGFLYAMLDNTGTIEKFKLDGTGRQIITPPSIITDTAYITDMAIAPNGDIWFSGELTDTDGQGWTVWKIDSTGSNLTPVIKSDDSAQQNQYTQADNLHIDASGNVYVMGPYQNDAITGSWSIWKIPADGSTITKVATQSEFSLMRNTTNPIATDAKGNVYAIGMHNGGDTLVSVFAMEQAPVTESPEETTAGGTPVVPAAPNTGIEPAPSTSAVLLVTAAALIGSISVAILAVAKRKR